MQKRATAFKDRVKSFAHDLGFELFGVAPAKLLTEAEHYPAWLENGYAGEMEYLHRQLPSRMDPQKILPDAASVIVVGIIYNSDAPTTNMINDPRRGWISRYAWGDDYHEIIQQRLQQLDDFLKKEVGESYRSRFYTDTGPVLDRVFAYHAGIGWYGKNTNLINQQLGSWFFIGEIITNVLFDFDQPPPDRCGSCRACLDACPTNAFVEPYVLDAQRCISYLTIELRGSVPVELRPQMGRHVFGCDICQDVCPWNREAATTGDGAFAPRPGNLAPDLAELAALDGEAFRRRFKNSPVKRAKHAGLLRNALIAMGNSGRAEFLPIIERFLAAGDEDISPERAMLREHAEWAYRRVQDAINETAHPAHDDFEVTRTQSIHSS
jgi:epoxyqueuosine reductase